MARAREADLSPDRAWTATGDLLLFQLANEHYCLKDICALLRRSEASVRARAAFLRGEPVRLAGLAASLAKPAPSVWASFHGVRTGRLHFR